jgi:demethylmenaquinone methyltransferase/2-methoxy-6-polyprenyl-1,4-benzoquinol methylase
MPSSTVYSKTEIQRMFSGLVPRYDLFNRWSSLGMDQSWRRALVRELASGQEVLDLGAGTGDLSRLSALKVGMGSPQPGGPRPRVVALDFSFEMLAHGQRAAWNFSPQGLSPLWVQASGDSLPFPSRHFDAIISAFVLRNLYKTGILKEVLDEAYRVLRPLGRVIFLDLTRPRWPPLRWGHRVYMEWALPAMGRFLFGARWPGQYLKTSIEDMLPGDRLKDLFSSCGFKDFQIRPLWGGVVSLFFGKKA